MANRHCKEHCQNIYLNISDVLTYHECTMAYMCSKKMRYSAGIWVPWSEVRILWQATVLYWWLITNSKVTVDAKWNNAYINDGGSIPPIATHLLKNTQQISNVIKLRGWVARQGVRVADKMLLIIAGIAVWISLCKLHHWEATASLQGSNPCLGPLT